MGAARRSCGSRPGSRTSSTTGRARSGATGSRGSASATRSCAMTSGAAVCRTASVGEPPARHMGRRSRGRRRRRRRRALRAARHLAGRRDRDRLRGAASGPCHRPRPLRRLRARPQASRQATEERALLASIQAGWDAPDPTFRRTFSMLFLPHGTTEQMRGSRISCARRPRRDAASLSTRAATSTSPRSRRRSRAARSCCTPAATGSSRSRRGSCSPRSFPGARLTLLDSPNHILLGRAGVGGVRRGAARLPRAARRRRLRHVGVEELSPRELEVLELVAAGLTNAAVAEQLCLSVRTVERHLANIYAKLRVSGKAGRAAAAARFAEHDTVGHALMRRVAAWCPSPCGPRDACTHRWRRRGCQPYVPPSDKRAGGRHHDH